MKILVNTQPLEFNIPTRDGDIDRILVKRSIASISDRYTFAHKLGRVPRKAYVVKSSGNFISCKISLNTSGSEQADADKITLEFNATGVAVVCIE